MLGILLAGTLAGALHVISGPDHVAAVAPIAVRGKSRGLKTGLRWGVGHTAGVALVALLAFFFREVLPLEALSEWSERLVGVFLIVIGFWAVRVALRDRVHVHEHEHDDGVTHSHFHVHNDRKHEAHSHAHDHAAVGMGALHGLAGSAHFLGVLPTLALPTRELAIAYLLGYGLGSILTMGGVGWVLGRVAQHMSVGAAYRNLLVGAGVVAVVVGVYWIVPL